MSDELARAVVAGMVARDAFSAWLGLEVTGVTEGRATCAMVVRPDMLNGFGVCHGGVTFALADSAFAFACNGQGQVAMSIETGMTYPSPVRAGDRLVAEAAQEDASRRIGFYRVVVRNQENVIVGLFHGTAYRTDRPHPAAEQAAGSVPGRA